MNLLNWIVLVVILILVAILFYLRTKRLGEESHTEAFEETEPTVMEDEESASDLPKENGTEEKQKE